MSFVYCKPTRKKSKKKTKVQVEAELQHKKELDQITSRFSRHSKHMVHAKKRDGTITVPQVPLDRQKQYPSLMSGGTPTSTSRNSIMDRLHLESAEVAAAILRKSKSLAIPFNKGAVQYLSAEEMAAWAGKKV